MPASINKVNPLFRLWLPVFICMAAIFSVSCIPGKKIVSLFRFQDVVFHFCIYALLAFFVYRALKKGHPALAAHKIIIFTLLFGVIYGITDEWHQSFVPGRSATLADLFIDASGTFCGGIFYRWLR